MTEAEIIYLYADIDYAGSPITSGGDIDFAVKIGNRWLSQDELIGAAYQSGSQLWRIIISAPDMALDKAYDIQVRVKYVSDGVFKSDTEPKALIYEDDKNPNIQSIAIPDKLNMSDSVSIFSNVTDSGAVDYVLVSITRPDGSQPVQIQNVLMTKEGYDENVYFFRYDLDGSWVNQYGAYIAYIAACDYSGNCVDDEAYFDAVDQTAWFGGFMVDIEHNNIPINNSYANIYRNGTDSLMYYMPSNESTGEFGAYIGLRSYDVEYVPEEQTKIILDNIYVDQGYADPFLVGLPDEETIGTGSGVIEAVSFNVTALLYTNVTVLFNYTNLDTSDIDIIFMGVYTCRIGFWLFGNNTCNNNYWTRENSFIDFSKKKVWIETTSVGGGYALAQYVCGNQQCELEFAENAANCPTDCPFIGGGEGGGGGGGGDDDGDDDGGETPPASPAPVTGAGGFIPSTGAPGSQIDTDDLRPANAVVDKNSIEKELELGELVVVSLDIVNNKANSMAVNVYIEGDIWQFIQIQNPSFSVPAKQGGSLTMKYYTLPTSNIGIYTGDIVLQLDKEVRRIATTLKVVPVKEALLDVKVNVLTPEVRPGGTLKFSTQLFNLGNTKKVDVWINYTVKSIETNKIIRSAEETRALTTTMEISRDEEIPVDTVGGTYVVEAVAHYGGKIASSLDTFQIVFINPFLELMYTAFTSIWVYIGIVVIIMFGRKFYASWAERREKKVRYSFPIDMDKVPKAGEGMLWMGNVAEHDGKAYLDMNQLMMHGIAAGGTGSGKTVSIMVLAEELLKQGVPIVVFDPTLQWTGFMKPSKDKHMLDKFPAFGLKPSDATGFKVNLIEATDILEEFDIRKFWEKPEMTVFTINKLPPGKLDDFVQNTINQIFKLSLPESKKLKVLIVYDEVHRLLPKYGGKGGYIALERGAREFRKWGIGLVMLSQVLMDFRGAIRANIGTEIQLRTKYEGDINRVKQKYGSHYASMITKLEIGTGLFPNPEYNNGKPYFVQFRPLLHDSSRMSDEELTTYFSVKKRMDEVRARVNKLKEKGVDAYDIEIEVNLAVDRIKEGSLNMANAYLDSVDKRLKKEGV